MVVFGGAGTLAVARAITSVLQSMPVDIQVGKIFILLIISMCMFILKSLQRCGYNGLMLPAAEDMGLAARAGEGKLSITNLLSYSSVCGTGIDTVPIPGDTSAESIALLYLDVVALSNKVRITMLSIYI